MVKTIFFYLDGVGYKFLDNLPYLKSLGKRGSLAKVSVEPLHQMEFCIFSSQWQKDMDLWTWYYYNPKRSLYKWTKILPGFFNKRIFKKAINYLTILKEYIKGNTHIVPIGNIPLKLLKYFDITSKKSFIDKNPIEIPTFFDVLRKNKVNYYSYEWPIYSTERKTGLKIMNKSDFDFLNETLKHKDKDFLFVHLTVFDALLHEKGSKDKETREYLKKMDKAIEGSCKILLKGNPNLNIIAASDHGMVDVKKGLDTLEILKNLNIIYFSDSTCIRAWGSKNEINILKSKLKNFPGKVYTEENKDKCPIQFKREYSGDLLFVVNPGYEIAPNFFNDKPVKAMHGYDRTTALDALFISNKKSTKKKRINNIDICPITLSVMNIKKPKIWKGKSS